MSKVIVGGYKLAPMEACALPEPVATGVNEVLMGLKGVRYLPVLYVGTQVVHGTNHMLICKQTMATQGAPEHLVEVVLNHQTDSECITGKWSLVSIEQIM